MFDLRKWSVGLIAACFVFTAAAGAQAQQDVEQASPEENAMEAPPAMNEVVSGGMTAPANEMTAAPAALEPPTGQPPIDGASQAPTVAPAPAADQKAVQAVAETTPKATVMEIKDEEAPTEWVWGEVVSTDQEVPSVTIKHLDYNTYEEVKATLLLTTKTLFENVKGLSDIKAGDRITADYRMKDGKNIAEMIVVDRPSGEQSKISSSVSAPSSQQGPAVADDMADTTAESPVDVMDQGDTAVNQGQVDAELAAMNAVTETDNAQNPS